MEPLTGSRHARRAIAAIATTLVMVSCGGEGGSTSPPQTTPPPPASGGSCSISLTAAITTVPTREKPVSTDDRRMRRGRVYEELWKHEAAAGGRRLAPASIAPASTAEDIGQVAVVRDEGDLVIAANPYDLRSIAVAFARNGSGGYDVRRSDRPFQSAVGEKIPLGDDDSARVTLPFSFPF